MTSVLSRKAQIPPFSYYIVENNDGYILRTLTLGDTISVNNDTILADRGKTVVIDGYIYRKVQVVTVSDVIIFGGQTGYICLNSDEAPLFDGENQGVMKLN
jgi:hypothetical protein